MAGDRTGGHPRMGGARMSGGMWLYAREAGHEYRARGAAIAALVMADDADAALTTAEGDYLAVQSAAAVVSLLWAVWQRNDPEGWHDIRAGMAAELQRIAAATTAPPDSGPGGPGDDAGPEPSSERDEP